MPKDFWSETIRVQGWLCAVLVVIALFIFGRISHAQSPSASPVGDHPFTSGQMLLSGSDGSIYDFEALIGDAKAVCFAFLYPRCPLSQEYAPVIDELAREFADSGVRFVGVICELDDEAEIEAYVSEYGISFPVHLDTEFKLATTLGVSITPEVVLVDRDRQIRYSGRIDDRFLVRGVMKLGDPQPELQVAIEEFLSGRVIGNPRTKAVGCPIDRPERSANPQPIVSESGKVTFNRDVLPFLNRHCQICHSPGQAGPFPLLTYADAVEWIDLGIEELEARRMPPAQIESDFDYRGPKSPTLAEIEMLKAWIADGKPEGTAVDIPQLESLPDYSAFQEDLGPPDLVIDLAEPTQLGAHGNDLYRNLIFDLNLPEDLRLRAFQLLPGNRRVVHHTLIGYLPREAAKKAVEEFGGGLGFDSQDDRAGGYWDPHGIGFRVPPPRDDGQPRSAFIGGFVPGVRAIVAPKDAVITIPAGCDISAQMHYVRTGKIETDSSRLGLWLAKEKPNKEMSVIYITGEFGVVPAGVRDFRVKGSWTIQQDADFIGVIPHAHQLARWVELRAHLPDSIEPKLILRVPQWDYNWQAAYYAQEPVHFPAGTRFEAECSYDNSAGNPRNPFNPARNIWHNETIEDEMLLPLLIFTSEKILDGKGDSFLKFWGSMQRTSFLRRLVEHRFKYIADLMGNVELSPDFDDQD